MNMPPDRIERLLQCLEQDRLTQHDCNKALALMDLDQAVLDREFIREHLERQAQADERITQQG